MTTLLLGDIGPINFKLLIEDFDQSVLMISVYNLHVFYIAYIRVLSSLLIFLLEIGSSLWLRAVGRIIRKLFLLSMKSVLNVISIRDIKRNLVLHHRQMMFGFILFSFSSRKFHKNDQMSDKINSHICLMLTVEFTKVFVKRSSMTVKEIL